MNRVTLGILLIVVGVLALSAYLFGSMLALAAYWPVLLILYGVILLQSERTAYAIGMMVVGIILLADNLLPLPQLGRLGDFWPLLLIILGVFLILGVTQASHEHARAHVASSPGRGTTVTVEARGRTVQVTEHPEGGAPTVHIRTAKAHEGAGGPASSAQAAEAEPGDEEEAAAVGGAAVEELPVSGSYESGQERFSVALPESVQSIHYDFHLSAGHLEVVGGTDELIEVVTDKGSCEPRFELSVSERDGKKVAHLRVEPEHLGSHLPIFGGSRWKVRLNRALPLVLALGANAARCELALVELAVEELHLENNAAKTEIRLGERVHEVNMQLENNAAKLKLLLPQTFGFDAEVDNNLGNHNLTSFGVERREGRYVSRGYEEGDFKLELRLSNNVGRFELESV